MREGVVGGCGGDSHPPRTREPEHTSFATRCEQVRKWYAFCSIRRRFLHHQCAREPCHVRAEVNMTLLEALRLQLEEDRNGPLGRVAPPGYPAHPRPGWQHQPRHDKPVTARTLLH
jgi:hypothetical protein